MQTETNDDVVVVGGGVAGLAAATMLATVGHRVALCERATTLGGRARTQERDGFLLNQGPHALYRRGPAATLLERLGVPIDGNLPPVSGALALAGNRLHALPGGAVSLLTTTLFGVRGRLQVARLMSRLPRLDAATFAGTPVDECIRRLAGRDDVAALVHALVRLTSYAHAPATMDSGLALAQLQHGLRHGVLYLHGGWQRLVDALAARAREAGVVVHGGAAVTGLVRDGAAVGGVTLRDGRTLRARAVLLALDAAAAAELLPDGAARRYAAAAVPVRAACLDLGLSRLPERRHAFALGIDRPIYFSVHSASARLAPGEGAMVHVARYLGDARPDPAALEAELEGVLDLVQPGWRRHVVVRRFLPDMVAASALVQAADGGLVGRPDVAVAEAPGLFLAGDWVGPAGWLLDASAESVRRAVSAMNASLGREAAAA